MKTIRYIIGNTRICTKIAAAVLCAIIIVPAVFTLFAYAAEPGSAGDPIALKSYVDSKLAALEAKLTGLIKNAAQQTDSQAGSQTGSQTGNQDAGQSMDITGNQTANQVSSGSSADTAALEARIDELTKKLDDLNASYTSLSRLVNQNASAGSAGSPVSGIGGAGVTAEKFSAVEVFANQRVVLGEGAEVVLRTGKALAVRGELGALVDLISGKDLDAGVSVPVNHLIISPRDDNRGFKVTDDAWILIKGAYEIR